MAGLDEAINDWYREIEKAVKLTPAEQSKITAAGANEFKKRLEAETQRKHYSQHDDHKKGHMADHITIQKADVDGQKDGSATVGWDNKFHATNARRLNDGTKKYTADHFVENVRHEAQSAVFEAEKREYEALMRKKGAK